MIIQDGEYCRLCGKLPDEGTLYLNRKEHDNPRNIIKNFQFLCKSCIAFRKKIECRDDLCVNNSDETAIKINREKQPMFRKAIYQMLAEEGHVDYHDIINSAAEALQLSPVTTKRYIDTMTSSLGRLKKGWKWGELLVKFKSKEEMMITCKEYKITCEDL